MLHFTKRKMYFPPFNSWNWSIAAAAAAAADADQEPINLNVFSSQKLNYTSVI